jgi:hypothetical protein
MAVVQIAMAAVAAAHNLSSVDAAGKLIDSANDVLLPSSFDKTGRKAVEDT